MISSIVHFIVMLGVMLTSFYAFVKSIKDTVIKEHKILCLAWCFLWAVLYAHAVSFYPGLSLIVIIFSCAASILLFYFLNKETIETNISAYMLSYGMSDLGFSS
jgi:divalent metal cation (Fe/Co/Zn/Cd) transporter